MVGQEKILKKLEAIVSSAVEQQINNSLISVREKLQLVSDQVQEVRDSFNCRRGLIGQRQIELAKSINIDLNDDLV